MLATKVLASLLVALSPSWAAGAEASSAFSTSIASGASHQPNSTTPFSTRMLSSIILRQQGLVSSGQSTSTLESGLISLAIQSWLSLYASPSATATTTTTGQAQNSLSGNFSNYVDSILASLSSMASFTNVTKTALLPLDRLTVAQAIHNLEFQESDSDVPTAPGNQTGNGGGSTHRELTMAEAVALDTLNASLAIQERNQYGGFWYYVYPSWSYLDGTVSFLPFMASQPTFFLPADALLQIQLLYTNAAHPSGLLAHGYDASKTAVWANNATGASPYVWGRSMGWYLAGLVNAWEILTTTSSLTNEANDVASQCNAVAGGCDALVAAIQAQFTQLVSVLVRYADPATGAWWQLPTLPSAPGNYLESSSTALFTFAILKGLRLNLPSPIHDSNNTTELLKATALRAYKYTTEKFVVDYGNGTLGYNNTVTVCSLNSTASYEYYVCQPINFNAPLGAAAFSLASLEVERLGL
ncbi:hypothetical protein N0V93_008515 [Gnomoniopsis smithogilvyi]|uniref:Uncharacterized protein n=1 Tax=Gnomoniopsis smithogilvyi TaxID=1191159 RepID=A0A9W8YQG2_9PEZI|nr:hypothetical protein N0V93_008515 [Gnomoniopsis smithogilvyi]